MVIDYINTWNDQVAHLKALQPASFSRLAFQHYLWVTYWAVMAGLGVYVSLFSDLIFMAALFVAMYLLYFRRAVPFSRVLELATSRDAANAGLHRIRLQVDEEGLHETVAGEVESFAPWSAFQRFMVTKDHLLIELTGNLWANVPRKSVEQGIAAFDELVAILRARGLSEQPSKIRR